MNWSLALFGATAIVLGTLNVAFAKRLEQANLSLERLVVSPDRHRPHPLARTRAHQTTGVLMVVGGGAILLWAALVS